MSESETPAAGTTPEPPRAEPEKTRVEAQWKHSSPLISCRFDPTGRFVFAGAQDSSVQRWELASGKRTSFEGHESWARGIAFHPDGRTVITGGYEGRLIWWPAAAERPEPARVVEAHDGWVRAVAVSPDGALVASTGNDLLVKLWSLEGGSLTATLRGHGSHVYNAAFHPGGGLLATGDLKGVVKLWEVPGGALRRELDASALYKYDKGFRADIGGTRGMSFSRDGRFLACAGITDVTNAFAGVGNPLVVVFDLEGDEARQYRSKDKLKGVAWGVAVHPQGFLVGAAGGSSGGYLFFWKPGETNEYHRVKLPNTARDLDLHPDSLRLATAHYDSHVRISRMQERPGAAEAG